MNAARTLKYARRKAGLSQRQLADRCGVAQPAIARIESGRVDPSISTLDRLLRSCGRELALEPRLGEGVDRSMLRELLKLTPGERAQLAVEEARNMAKLGLATRHG